MKSPEEIALSLANYFDWGLSSEQYHEVLEALQSERAKVEMLKKAMEKAKTLFRYCYGPTRDVKTNKLMQGEELCEQALKELESLE